MCEFFAGLYASRAYILVGEAGIHALRRHDRTMPVVHAMLQYDGCLHLPLCVWIPRACMEHSAQQAHIRYRAAPPYAALAAHRGRALAVAPS